ncbi:coiled-coil domain-containing protein 83 [Sarcophilus harrisii]|uniref:Coiled-coil domain containing 83 n=1 Tax=Sarcophilus harrisii TaxID=9305 RepID=G3VWX5_SARHA|nr:coiled-coil domain-containing protein 83 [Sarcophilus harrisii]XP_031817735.1 coiled-coil domain-containing protein 83 [Sarcophilus harrisii]XP_031817736.1 coiled-coil domain-containing protein 83 [Sarcophilus harrisii]XP_031817737.1 coiled-coil domain-containing protein 83 [Sarcophilus harrisii]
MGKKKKKEIQDDQAETKAPVSEALLEYYCQIKEDAIERLMVQVRKLRDKNLKSHERNARLKSEQLWHIKNLLSDLTEEQKKAEAATVVTREEVEEALKQKWKFIKDQEQNLKDMRLQISNAEKTFLEKLGEREYWEEYKNVGSEQHAKLINSLENDISLVKENTRKMSEYYRASLDETRKRISSNTLKQMVEKKELATQNAVKNIDKRSNREILENDWLKKEVELHKKEVAELEHAIHHLEEENLLLISQLFDCRLADLKINRPLFLTQAAGLGEQKDFPEEIQPETNLESEPLMKKSETELLSLSKRLSFLYEDNEENINELQKSIEGTDHDPCIEFGASDLSYLLYEDEKDFKEYTDMGPLEVRLMAIEGQKKPILEGLKEMTKKDWLDAGETGNTITYKMICSLKD